MYDKWSAKQIHNYEQNQRFEPTEISLHEGATTAPPLLTEADLIALMEKHGIGTDATHAEHINTIKERGYIGVLDKGALVPGVIGMGLYEGYDAMELALAKPMLRAEFEVDLKRVCLGQKDPKLVLREQIAKYKQAYQQIMDKVSAMDAKIAQRINDTPAAASGDDTVATESTNTFHELFQCPKCDVASLALKPKKKVPGCFFIGCLNFPDCKNVVWLPEECKDISVLDECCASCGDGYHMLKFRLSSAYYRGVFNTPGGWYKTCLRCDDLFRSTFNINLDQVKRVGNIVAQGSGSSGGPGPGPGGGGGVAGGNGGGPKSSGSGWGLGDGSGSATQKATKQTRTKKAAGDTTEKPKATRTKRKNSAPAGSIRNYFTNVQEEANSIDGFFDSNDGFDQHLLAVVDQAEADIAAAFAADDDADFEALLNADASGNDPRPPPSPSENLETSLTQWVRNEYEAEEQPMVWGRQARAADEPQQYAKRQRLSGDAGGSSTAAVVRCTGCHQPARQLTVQRDGPNKGRQFYKCPKPNECKFFQWADEQPAAKSSSINPQDSGDNSSASWGTNLISGNSQSETSWSSSNNYGFSRETSGSGSRQNKTNSKTDNSSWGSISSQQNSSREAGGTGWAASDSFRSSQPSTNNVQSNSWNRSNNSSGGGGSSTYIRSNLSTVTITQTKTSANGNDLQCNCGKPTKSLTVVKDGPNKGRPFFACATRDSGCGFFQWGDTDENQGRLNYIS